MVSSGFSRADVYGGDTSNVSQFPSTQVASGGSATISPLIPTFWIGALLVLVIIRVVYELAD